MRATTVPSASYFRNVDFGHAARSCSSDRGGNVCKPVLDQLPPCFAKHYHGNPPTREVLLMSDVSVCRDEYIEAGCFRGVQQFAVL